MARKRKAREDDPNQLMLFSLEEMSGEGDQPDLKDLKVPKEGLAGRSPAPTPSGDLESGPSPVEMEPGPSSVELEPEPSSDEMEPKFPSTDEEPEQSSDDEVSEQSSDEEEPEQSSDDEAIKPSSSGVELMSNVIRLLDGLSPSVVRLVAMQSAALVQGGVDSLEHYRIPSLSGMVFRGDALERSAYASFVRSFPNMVDKLGLDFSAEYEEAE